MKIIKKMINKIYILDSKIFEQESLFKYWYSFMPKERQDKIDKKEFKEDLK